jgi:hypothetical protein
MKACSFSSNLLWHPAYLPSDQIDLREISVQRTMHHIKGWNLEAMVSSPSLADRSSNLCIFSSIL